MADWIPQRAEELTPEWLDEVLREGGYLDEGRVVGLDVEPMGEGLGFVGQVLRLRPTYEDAPAAAPVSLIAKLPGTVDKNRGAVEAGHGSEREIRFFRELAPDSALATPHCYLTLMDPDPKEAHRERDRESLERLPLWLIGLLVSLGTRLAGRSQRRYLLLIEDLAPRPVGDQIAGCELEPARRVARDLAGLHASFWDDPRLEEAQVWLPRLNGAPRLARAMYKKGRAQFLKEAGAFLPDGFMEAMDWVYENMEAVLDGVAARPFTCFMATIDSTTCSLARRRSSPWIGRAWPGAEGFWIGPTLCWAASRELRGARRAVLADGLSRRFAVARRRRLHVRRMSPGLRSVQIGHRLRECRRRPPDRHRWRPGRETPEVDSAPTLSPLAAPALGSFAVLIREQGPGQTRSPASRSVSSMPWLTLSSRKKLIWPPSYQTVRGAPQCSIRSRT